jgi:NAD(P)-dependent dehydrogenase (short-subunit alcohol dehydrogenase family)
MSNSLCVVVGVGPGNGAAIARRFSSAGYDLALLARGTDFTAGLAAELGSARAFACDVSDPGAVEAAFREIRRAIGDVDVLVYNAGSGVWGTVEEIDKEGFESSWRVNALGALVCAQQVIPAMKANGEGAIVFIGATASRRGAKRTAAFAPAKAAQRSLAESMARHLWPAGVHVALVVIDGKTARRGRSKSKRGRSERSGRSDAQASWAGAATVGD